MGWIILLFIVMIIIITVVTSANHKEKVQTHTDSKQSFIKSENITISNEYSHKGDGISLLDVSVIADNKKHAIYISQSLGAYYCIPFASIIGCELFIDDNHSGGIGRAVVGGLIAGEAGAIVGAVTAPKKVKKYDIVIYVQSVSNPKRTISLMTGNVKHNTSSSEYKAADAFARNIVALVKTIVSINSDSTAYSSGSERISNSSSDIPVRNNTSFSSTAKFKELKELYDQGLITKEEYEDKRREIIRSI